MSNPARTVLYIGVTADLPKRIIQHKNGTGSAFTAKYNVVDLVYFEEFTAIEQAIARETQLKNWHREWKYNLIKSLNPELKDLSYSFLGQDPE